MKIRVGVLPSLITLGNLVSGFAAIGIATYGQLNLDKTIAWRGLDVFAIAGSLILLAMAFDALDGKIARMTNQTSEFGAQLDSLCDMVSFGIAPAYVVFLEALSNDLFRKDRYAWVCALLYIVCTALRLARFNVESDPDDESHLHFNGLPSPAAAGVIASLVILHSSGKPDMIWPIAVLPFVTVILGGLMMSRVRYTHLLNVLFRERKPLVYLVVLVFGLSVLVALAQHFELILLVGFSGYVLSGPLALAWSRARGRKPQAPPADSEDDGSDDPASIF